MAAQAPRRHHADALATLPEGAPATAPAEARGLTRDGVRLLVARGGAEPDRGGLEHARFRDLAGFLRPGDLLIVNTSATLPAAVDGRHHRRGELTVHFSTLLDGHERAVEVRPPGRAEGPLQGVRAGDRITLPGAAALTVVEPWPDRPSGQPRLWRARPTGADLDTVLRRHGRPIAYAYVDQRWPLEYYQTVFARDPGSAEMPSAGRPFSHDLVLDLVSRGVGIAPITLHTGVSSLEADEPPLPEPFRVPAATAARVAAARAGGGRVIAVGTTAARAIETAASPTGAVVGREGWTDLILSPDRPPRVVDGLITGWHAPGASHLLLLQAVAGERLVHEAYRAAAGGGYLWHEFGDACILLP